MRFTVDFVVNDAIIKERQAVEVLKALNAIAGLVLHGDISGDIYRDNGLQDQRGYEVIGRWELMPEDESDKGGI
jgi:hypothetical protein